MSWHKHIVILAMALAVLGCPAPRYLYYIRTGDSNDPRKFVKGKWEFASRGISYEIRVEERPEMDQSAGIVIRAKNRSDSMLYYDWTVARILGDRGSLSPTKRGFTTTFSPPDTGLLALSPGEETWEWIFFRDTARVFSSSVCQVESGLFRDASGAVLHVIPTFMIKLSDMYRM